MSWAKKITGKTRKGIATMAAALFLLGAPLLSKSDEINISNSFANEKNRNSLEFKINHEEEFDLGDKYVPQSGPVSLRAIGPTPFSDSKKIFSGTNSSVSLFAKTSDLRTEHPDYCGVRIRSENDGSRADLILGGELVGSRSIPYLSSFNIIRIPGGNLILAADISTNEGIYSAGFFNSNNAVGYGAFLTYDTLDRKSLEQIVITDGNLLSRRHAYYITNFPEDPIWATPFDFAERGGIRLEHSYSAPDRNDRISAEAMIYPFSYAAGRENIGNWFVGAKWDRTSMPGEKSESAWVSTGYTSGSIRIYLSKEVSGKEKLAGGFDVTLETQKLAALRGFADYDLISLGTLLGGVGK